MAAAQATDSFGIPLKPVNADLAREREKATFNVQELTHFIDGGPERTKRRKELGKRKQGGREFSSSWLSRQKRQIVWDTQGSKVAEYSQCITLMLLSDTRCACTCVDIMNFSDVEGK